MQNFDDTLFCANCDYAIHKKMIDAAISDFGCPRCKNSFENFYSLGSRTHKMRRDAFERGEIFGSPLPFRATSDPGRFFSVHHKGKT